jgi:hypothetical protein
MPLLFGNSNPRTSRSAAESRLWTVFEQPLAIAFASGSLKLQFLLARLYSQTTRSQLVGRTAWVSSMRLYCWF